MKHFKFALALFASFALTGCGGRPAGESPAAAPSVGATTMAPTPGAGLSASPTAAPTTAGDYDIRGTITEYVVTSLAKR